MDEQRRNRLAAAVTINVILLIVILAVVAVYQIAAIASASAERAEVKKELEQYEQLLKDEQNNIDYVKSEQYFWDLLMRDYYSPNP